MNSSFSASVFVIDEPFVRRIGAAGRLVFDGGAVLFVLLLAAVLIVPVLRAIGPAAVGFAAGAGRFIGGRRHSDEQDTSNETPRRKRSHPHLRENHDCTGPEASNHTLTCKNASTDLKRGGI
jgi:hypothetical protein